MRTGRGGRIAVAAASALLAVCLAGGPLYISSTASEAVQVGLSSTCLADAGLHFDLFGGFDFVTGQQASPAGRELLDELAAGLANTEPPIITYTTSPVEFHAVGDENTSFTRVILLARDGQLDHLDIGAADPGLLADGEAIAPVWDAEVFGVGASNQIEVTIEPPLIFVSDENGADGSVVPVEGDPQIIPLSVSGTYADIPTRPEPSFWCAERALFRLKPSGDRQLPVAFVNSTTVTEMQPTLTWELRPVADGLTRHEARELIKAFDAINAAFLGEMGSTPDQIAESPTATQLPDLVHRAELLTEVVSRTIAPVRLGGVGAAAMLLVASGVMVARERRRDLRLRVLRGVNPVLIALRVSAGELVAVFGGTALGTLVVFGAVRTLGPTPEFEPDPVRVAIVAALVGGAAATVLVGAVAALATTRGVDARPRRRHRAIPWEWLLIPLTVVSYQRLDQVGGVRLLGAEARGGDLLAQAFPILALAGPLALLARPLAALAKRAKRVGRNLRPPMLIGLRRVSHEPVASMILCVAVAFAIGAYMVSGSLTASAEQLLRDKTNTYLGGDMVVRTRTLDTIPTELADQATPIALVNANSGGKAVDIIGIDPATFAGAVHWREDASATSLATLIESIVDDSGATAGPLKAIVVGDIGDGTVITKNRDELQISTVAEPDWFPGVHRGTEMVVVDVAALQARDLPVQPFIWLTDPPANTEQLLVANGTGILNIRESGDVFEVTSFLTVRWSYAVLAAFGVLVGCAALFAQLLVLDARRRARQATWTITSRMGMSMRNEATAIVIELGLPLGLGTLLGLGLGWIAVIVAVPPLDTIRHLQPPARVVIDLGGIAAAAAVGAAALVALTAIGLVTVARTRPMEVMRGTN